MLSIWKMFFAVWVAGALAGCCGSGCGGWNGCNSCCGMASNACYPPPVAQVNP